MRYAFVCTAALAALALLPARAAAAINVTQSCPTTVAVGATLTCTTTVSATGTDSSTGIYQQQVPSGTTFLSVSGTGGSTCPSSAPVVGGTGFVQCTVSVTGGTAQASQTFTLNVLVGPTATTPVGSLACLESVTPVFETCVPPDNSTTVTAVTLRGIAATRTARGVLVRWRTASEVDTLGYNVYRLRAGRRVRLNRHVIPAKNRGARYSFLDRSATSGPARYYVQAISLDGARAWYGPAVLAR
jgi:uncharacterized repeat protein (TIGR01451 family)